MRNEKDKPYQVESRGKGEIRQFNPNQPPEPGTPDLDGKERGWPAVAIRLEDGTETVFHSDSFWRLHVTLAEDIQRELAKLGKKYTILDSGWVVGGKYENKLTSAYGQILSQKEVRELEKRINTKSG